MTNHYLCLSRLHWNTGVEILNKANIGKMLIYQDDKLYHPLTVYWHCLLPSNTNNNRFLSFP